MTQPGAGFSLDQADLTKAEKDLDERADEARTQFNKLESVVLGGTSSGAAFTAAHQVAGRLKEQGLKLEALLKELSENIRRSAKEYGQTSAVGADAIRSVESMVTGGATFSRLTPGNQ